MIRHLAGLARQRRHRSLDSLRRTCRARAAFTLIELMVTLTIISLLIALLLPAVQQARESARRAQCRNNLRQIGIAITNYHDSFRSLPPGGITPGSWSASLNGTSWAISILPQIDQQSLYERYDFVSPNESPANAFVRERPVPIYLCPSDPNHGVLAFPQSGPGSELLYATGSYRAMSGKSDGVERPNGAYWYDVGNFLPRNWRGAMHHVGTAGLRTERLDDVIDGTSQTLLVGEYTSQACSGESPCRRTTFWAYTYTSYNQSSACPECGERTMIPDFDECLGRAGDGDLNACKRSWGSLHPGGMHFLACDGSVRFIKSSIDRATFGSLATIAGNDLVLE